MSKDSDENQHADFGLFQEFCEGQSTATKKLHDQTFPLIWALLKKYRANREDSRDLMQEGAMALLGYCGKSEFQLRVTLKSFYYSICKRIWLKKMEKKGRSPVTNSDLSEYVNMKTYLQWEEEAQQKGERLLLIQKQLHLLNKKERGLIIAYYTQEKSFDEIAPEFGFDTAGAARTAKFRALAKLRRLTRQDPDYK